MAASSRLCTLICLYSLWAYVFTVLVVIPSWVLISLLERPQASISQTWFRRLGNWGASTFKDSLPPGDVGAFAFVLAGALLARV